MAVSGLLLGSVRSYEDWGASPSLLCYCLSGAVARPRCNWAVRLLIRKASLPRLYLVPTIITGPMLTLIDLRGISLV